MKIWTDYNAHDAEYKRRKGDSRLGWDTAEGTERNLEGWSRDHVHEGIICGLIINFTKVALDLRRPLLLPIVGQVAAPTPDLTFRIVKISDRNKLLTLVTEKGMNSILNISPYYF